MPLDPRADFCDDGGTPMWRGQAELARQRVIDVTPAWAGMRYRLRRMKLRHVIILALFFGLILPWTILIGGIGLMTLLGINPG